MRNRVALVVLMGLLITACDNGAAIPTTAVPRMTTITTDTTGAAIGTTAAPTDMDALIHAAQAEGTLTTIGLPHDFCNYGGVIDGFGTEFGLDVNELAPEAGSADALEAIRVNTGGPGPEVPDVIDIWISFGSDARGEGLLTPYKVSTWDAIPAAVKDADGYWYGGYYGNLAFEVNADVVGDIPEDWADLLDPIYKGQITLAGDPRVSNQAIFAVFAASLASGGNLDDAQAGLDFFAQLNEAGNLAPAIAESGTVASGETPITFRWTYNALANRDTNSDLANIEVAVPATGRIAGVYVQGISAFAPHPNAAKLWMEFLYSDEGQNLWLSGFCNPIRYEDMVHRGAISPERARQLPDSAGAVFPSIEQINAASELITTQWDSVVGVNVGGA